MNQAKVSSRNLSGTDESIKLHSRHENRLALAIKIESLFVVGTEGVWNYVANTFRF